MTDEIHECQEAYKDCVAARKARVEAVLKSADPWETTEEIAEKAAVDPSTIKRAKAALLQFGSADPNCNSRPRVKKADLKSLYLDKDCGQDADGNTIDPELTIGFSPNVTTIERALNRCSYAELAYVICRLFPVFKQVLEQHYLKGAKQNGKTSGTSSENYVTDAAN